MRRKPPRIGKLVGIEEAPDKGVRLQKLDAEDRAPMVRSDEVIQ